MRAACDARRCDVKCPCCGKPLDVEEGDMRPAPGGGWPQAADTGCPGCGGRMRVWMRGLGRFAAAALPSPAPSRARPAPGCGRGKAR